MYLIVSFAKYFRVKQDLEQVLTLAFCFEEKEAEVTNIWVKFRILSSCTFWREFFSSNSWDNWSFSIAWIWVFEDTFHKKNINQTC